MMVPKALLFPRSSHPQADRMSFGCLNFPRDELCSPGNLKGLVWFQRVADSHFASEAKNWGFGEAGLSQQLSGTAFVKDNT